MLRTLLGMALGTGVAALAAWGARLAYLRLHPAQPPSELDTLQSLSLHAAAAPLQAIACVLAGWALAAFAGGWTAALIARGNQAPAALTVGTLVTLAALVHAATVPSPEWVAVLGVLLPLPCCVLAKLLATPRHAI